MSRPLVSIVICTYNQLPFVDETIESAVAQEWEPLEIVIADDGSTDGTFERATEWASRYPGRVRVAPRGPRRGITGNCNRGFFESRGSLVAFQGGDDVLLPGKIAAQAAWFEASPARTLSGHDVEHFLSSSGERICLHSEITPLASGVGPFGIVTRGCPYAATSLMVRRSAVPDYGFDERLPMVSDLKLAIDCVLSGGEYGFVPGVYARYRRHARSVTVADSPQCHTETFMTFAILEAERPELGEACARARARLHYSAGVRALLRGEVDRARQELLSSVRSWPTYSKKLPLWMLLAYAPPALRDRAFELPRFRGARQVQRSLDSAKAG